MERELTSDESDERGTPHHRFALLLKHLDDRFPDKEWYSAQAPEGRYLAAIDARRSSLALKEAEIERLKEAVEWATEQIPDCLTEYCGDGLTRAWSGYGFKAELRRRAYGEG